MRIEPLSPELVQAYDQYLIRKNYSLFYYSSKYKDFLKQLLGCQEEYLVAMKRDVICGILPLMYVEVDSRRIYNSLPYYGSTGGVLADDVEAYSNLLKAYNEIARSEITLSSTIVTNPLVGQNSGGIVHNYTDYRIGQLTRLSEKRDNWEGLLGRIESSARRNVKKALRKGVTVEVDHNQLGRLYEIHKENIHAVGGIPKSKSFFRLISQFFLPGMDFDLYVAKLNGVIIAGLLLFYFNQTVEYFTPAIDSIYRSYQPLALILITAITDVARRGFIWWNWGGTWPGQTGVYRFKKKWAAMEGKYYYYTQLNDSSVLSWPKEAILNTFPNFFVVPFSDLKDEAENG